MIPLKVTMCNPTVPSLKRVEQIGKIMTAQADEITHLKEQRTQLLDQRLEFEKGTD